MWNGLGSQVKAGPRDRSYKRFILIPEGFHEAKYLVEFLHKSLLPGHLDLQGRVCVCLGVCAGMCACIQREEDAEKEP